MDYIFEEGQKIEPNWYLPIIPMILVNGCEGIGTGWRSQLPCFNPHEIVKSLKSKLKGNEFLKLEPWYKGYQGEIKENPQNKGTYIVTGKYHWDENDPKKVIITEIPIKKWTEDYKYFLQELMGIEIVSRNNDDSKSQKKKGKNNGRKKSQDNSEDEEKQKKKKKEIIIEDLRENHTYNRVCFEVTLLDEFAKKFRENDELFMKTFNLTSTLNIKNMVLFSPEGKLKKYNSIEEILETFYNLRLKYYHLRKDYMISVLKKEVATLSNKARFIKMVIEDELIIRKKKRAVLVNELYDLKFDTQTMLNEKKQKTKEEKNRELELANSGEKGEENEANNSDDEKENPSKDKIKPKVPIKEYDYLLNMNLWSLTQEKIEELLKQKEQKEKELSILEQTEVETLWDNDLDDFEEELTKYEKAEEEDRLLAKKLNKNKSGEAHKRRRGGGRKKKNSPGKSEDNDDNSDNSNSNNTSLISDSTEVVTKKTKTKNKRQKTKKGKGQSSINDFVQSTNKKEKKKKQENKIENLDEEDKSKTSDNEEDSSENDENENNPFNVPLKERLKKRIVDIGESPIPLDNLSYGKRADRKFSDDSFADLNLDDFDDKEKVEL